MHTTVNSLTVTLITVKGFYIGIYDPMSYRPDNFVEYRVYVQFFQFFLIFHQLWKQKNADAILIC